MKIKLCLKIELLVLHSFYDRKFIITVYQQRSLVWDWEKLQAENSLELKDNTNNGVRRQEM